LLAVDALDVTLNLVHSDLIRLLNRVPNTEVASVLGHNDIGVRHPAHILTVVQKGLLLLFLNVEQVKLLSLVLEQELAATWVQFEVVDLGVMVDGSLDLVVSQVLDADGHLIEQVSDDLGGLTAILEVLLGIVETSRDHLRVDVLSTAGTNDFIDTVLDNRELTSVEHHADVRVGEVELLVSRATPWELGKLAGLHVTEEESAVGGGDQEAILVDIDLLDLVSLVGLEHDLLVVLDLLNYDLRK